MLRKVLCFVLLFALCGRDLYAQQTAMVAIGDAVTEDIGNRSGAAFQLTGTCTTGVVTFEGTVDGSNWLALEVIPIGTAIRVTTAAVAGIWMANVGGLNKIRMRVTDACDANNFLGSIRVGGTTKTS